MWGAADYDAIAREQRRPGREGVGEPLDLRELGRLGALAASSHNTQPWRFRLAAGALSIEPDLSRRCPAVDPDESHLYKSLGCAAENIVHAAAAQGQVAHLRFDAGTSRLPIAFERSPSARAGPLFHAIVLRQCTRSRYGGQALERDALLRLEAAGAGEGVRTIILVERARIARVADYVAEGNRLQFGDAEFRAELIRWIRFNPRAAIACRDGLAGRTSGQPPLPSWLGRALAPFLLTGRSQNRRDIGDILGSGAIAIFVATRDDPAAWVETGRAYERVALEATALGIANAFINQPIEVRPLRPQLESWLGLSGERALLMARLGHGPRTPFSLRRPLDDVIVE